MKLLIEQFPNQLKKGLEIAAKANINTHNVEIHNITILGIGGSGLAGNIINTLVRDYCKIPIFVSKTYTTPAYIGSNSLVILASFSGNTEETLHAYNTIKTSGAKIIPIASGGKVIEIAKSSNLDYIILPHCPSARAGIGYAIAAQLYLLSKLDLIPDSLIQEFSNSIDLVRFNTDEIQFGAQKVARRLVDKTPVLYPTERMKHIGLRWKQQFNENSKSLAWCNTIPEMNHNELTGWSGNNNDLAVIFLTTKTDFSRNNSRVKLNKHILKEYCDTIIEVQAKGKNICEQAMYLLHFGDWVSYYLSDMTDIDCMSMKTVAYLKSELNKV